MKPRYSVEQINQITLFLHQKGTLDFSPLPNGLFPAAAFGKDKSYTGYSYTWVRDNVHVAHAHYVAGVVLTATKTVQTLMEYFIKYRHRFVDIIAGRTDPANPMNRPHIRFEGKTLAEVGEKWAHAQNDALGYFLWIFCKLVNEGKLDPSQDELNMLALFPLYFQAIQFWQDEDSGHWEEIRKISASSIGVVIAGLQEFEKIVARRGPIHDQAGIVDSSLLESLITHGRQALSSILPAECVQPGSARRRLYD